VTKKLKGFRNKGLDEFIMTADIGYEAKNGQIKGSGTDLQNALKGVSNSELDAFLKQVPTANDDLYLIN